MRSQDVNAARYVFSWLVQENERSASPAPLDFARGDKALLTSKTVDWDNTFACDRAEPNVKCGSERAGTRVPALHYTYAA